MPIDALETDQDVEQSQGLLAEEHNEPELQSELEQPSRPQRISIPPRRPSGLLKTSNGGLRTPRTSNRVRFDIEENPSNEHELVDQGGQDQLRADNPPSPGSIDGDESQTGQRVPLLTNIEAPSVTVANDWDFNAEDYLEDARPKSGMRSAFLNMANSIM